MPNVQQKPPAILSLLWGATWPTMITFGLMASIGISDLYLAGQINPAAQATVGIGDQILFLTVAVSTGLSVGTCAIVSRSVGEGSIHASRVYCLAGLIAAVVFGVIAALIGWFYSGPLISFFSSATAVTTYGARYIQDCAPANLPSAIVTILSAIFRGLGCPKKSIVVWTVIATGSLAASLIMFYVGIPFVHIHSIEALAFGWDIGAFMGAAVALYQLLKMMPANSDKFEISEVTAAFIETIKIGVPAIGTEACGIIVGFLTYRLIGSDDAQAAWTIYLKIEETFAFMPLMSLALAVAAVVGQNLGANNIDRARQISSTAAAIGVVVMTVTGTILWLAAPLYATWLSSDQAVAGIVISLFQGASILLPLYALRVVLLAALEGASQTTVPMMINIAGGIGFFVLFSLLSGDTTAPMSGIWLSLAATRAALAVAAMGAFAFIQFRNVRQQFAI